MHKAVKALIAQDAGAHNEGLGANWATRRAFWADRPAYEDALRKNLLSLETTRTRHVGDDPNVELYDPHLWKDEYASLNAPGQAQIQSDLFYDYRMNVESYPKWQAWLQKTQPKLLILWGKHDLSFDLGEPERYRKDVPNAEIHILDAGYFALDTKADEIAALVRGLMLNGSECSASVRTAHRPEARALEILRSKLDIGLFPLSLELVPDEARCLGFGLQFQGSH